MEIIHESGNVTVLAAHRGEEVLSAFSEFVSRQNIRAAHVTGLGAAESLEIAFYNLETKEYERKRTNFDVEVLSLVGNVALYEGRPIIHIHGVFGKRDFSAFGGHVFELVAGGTCELHLTALDGFMTRTHDASTGLKLLCPID